MQQADVSWSMPRCVDHLNASGDVQYVAIGEFSCDGNRCERSGGGPLDQSAEATGGVTRRHDPISDKARVIVVSSHAIQSGRLGHFQGAARMIVVCVGKDDLRDVARMLARDSQTPHDPSGRAGQTAIDQRDLAVVVDERIGVDEVPESGNAIDPSCDLNCWRRHTITVGRLE